MAETTRFEDLLNTLEDQVQIAATREEHRYPEARAAVIEYVEGLEKKAALVTGIAHRLHQIAQEVGRG